MFEIGEQVWFSNGGRDHSWWDKEVVLDKEKRRSIFGKKKWFYLVKWGFEAHWYPENHLRKITRHNK